MQAALNYAAQGFAVLPIWYVDPRTGHCACSEGAACDRPAKHPMSHHGVKQATTGEARIHSWWSRHPQANVAVATGEASGLIVIDVDTADGKQGDVSITQACAPHGGVPPTLEARSASGGRHYFYRYRPGAPKRKTNFLKHVDYLSDEGYVLVEPSATARGKYEFAGAGSLADLRGRMGDLPEWFDALREPKRVGKRRGGQPGPNAQFDAHDPAQVATLRDALAHIDADDRDNWVKFGFALGRAFDRSDAGWEIYDEWAARSSKYSDRGTNKAMRAYYYLDSLKDPPSGDPVGVGTIYHLAREAGWQPPPPPGLEDFVAYRPDNDYIYLPTRGHWPAASVNAHVRESANDGNRLVPPSTWLDRHRAVVQKVWDPGQPQLIEGWVMHEAGWREQAGARVFNEYRPASPPAGDPTKAGPWVDHARRLFPDGADHIVRWLAQRVQAPNVKVNHALVVGGAPGIGKDTLLHPVRAAVGKWNVEDVSPQAVLGRFNKWARCVLLVISEARDLGDADRYDFYERSKGFIAAPPDVLRVDAKFKSEHYVPNVVGVVITTNHKTDGLYLPADDRRHYVAWSDVRSEDLGEDYFRQLYHWLVAEGGVGHVAAYLRSLDLSGFDPKAPPPKTPAFWSMVQAGEAPEAGALRDAFEHIRAAEGDVAVTKLCVAGALKAVGQADFARDLLDTKNSRRLRHWMEEGGYSYVQCQTTSDGRWKVGAKNLAVYAPCRLTYADQVKAAQALVQRGIRF